MFLYEANQDAGSEQCANLLSAWVLLLASIIDSHLSGNDVFRDTLMSN